MLLDGHSAIVTGGGSGLGAETARQLAANGVKVALLDMNMDAAKSVADEISGVAVECDVSSAESGEAGVAASREAIGAARICVNCAGIGPAARIVGRNGPQALSAFERVISVNLIGTFNIMRLAAADMMTLEPLDEVGERGVIINTASVATFEGQIGQAAYSASKGGVASMTLPAAREFSKFGIRVLTIAPGIIDTPMAATMTPEIAAALAASVPFPKRLGYPREYADLALHMMTNQMLNGEVVRLDGAIRMAPK